MSSDIDKATSILTQDHARHPCISASQTARVCPLAAAASMFQRVFGPTCMLASCNIFSMEVKKGHWYAEAAQAAGGCGSTMHTRNAEEPARTAEAWL